MPELAPVMSTDMSLISRIRAFSYVSNEFAAIGGPQGSDTAEPDAAMPGSAQAISGLPWVPGNGGGA